jgi:subfamily B ATP-binding cassette protein MsbA
MAQVFKKIFELVGPYKTRFVLGLLCGVLSGLFTPALPLAAKVAVRVIFNSKKPDATASAYPAATATGTNAPSISAVPNTPSSGLLSGGLAGAKLGKSASFLNRWEQKLSPEGPSSLGVLIAVIASIPLVMLIRGVLAFLNAYLLSWVAMRAIADLRKRIFQHVMGLSMDFFNRVGTGDLMSRFYETALLQTTITSSISVVIREPISVISLLGVLLIQQTRLTLITMLVFPLCILPVVIYGRKLRKSTKALQENSSTLSGVMHESFTGSRVIKAYTLEEKVVDQFRRFTDIATSLSMKAVRASEIPGPLIEFFASIGVALIFVYFAFLADSNAGPDDLLQFVITIFLLYPPIKSLSRLHSQVITAQTVYRRVDELLQTKNSIPEPAHPAPLHAAHAEIQFDNVDFDYGDKPVLRNIQLTIKPNELVALVGGSGAGKTTITSLLLRFFDPVRGVIRIGGTDLREVATADLRAQMAVVTQETVLFNETIRNNIDLGRPGASDADIEAAARGAFAYDFIMEKPQGFDTVVGEKGAMLSGGQRQRIAIARAILKNAPILILDEATSALDTESERAVQAALEELMKGRTTLCIAHRLSTIYKADRIVVMDQGRIVEIGSHEELLAKNGHYRRLYELQFQG